MTQFSMEGEKQQIAVSVPLFLRKLWKMVNDQEAEDIIGWNLTGDGFVIYDQLQFITKLLPKYFKHNNMASFIRQLNFYDFHKVSGIDKDEIQFTHSCFLKDLPETLVFIRRKCTSLRSKLATAKDEEVTEILGSVKELKTKHSLVDNELRMLKQENAALWNEVNNLRLKHAKQTKIINKIIHFLISYMHSHQSSLSKGKVSVRRNSQNIKTGPTILEIGYHSGTNDAQDKTKQSSYSFTEPGHSGAITYPSSELDSSSNMQPAERTLDEILVKVGASLNKNKDLVRARVHRSNSKINVINEKASSSSDSDLDTNLPQNSDTNAGVYNSENIKKEVPLQKPLKYDILQNPKENLGTYLSNTQVELESLQDILNNLNSTELTNFCNLMENSEMGNSKESREELADIYQDINEEPVVTCEDNPEENDENVNCSLADEFVTLPNTVDEMYMDNGEYNDTLPAQEDLESGQDTTEENLTNIEPEILPDEYFTI